MVATAMSRFSGASAPVAPDTPAAPPASVAARGLAGLAGWLPHPAAARPAAARKVAARPAKRTRASNPRPVAIVRNGIVGSPSLARAGASVPGKGPGQVPRGKGLAAGDCAVLATWPGPARAGACYAPAQPPVRVADARRRATPIPA